MGLLSRLFPDNGSTGSIGSNTYSDRPEKQKFTTAQIEAWGRESGTDVKTRGNRAVITRRFAHRATATGFDRNPDGTWSAAG
ncbi:hypothetical protein AB0K62_13720 [Streptomyces halstedii]|uniref:hypothetical protein n=1 Tax=Streptomyces TaxID=1883 RepID=UPI000805C42F|nr:MULTISPECIES: hypothetical protein [unclassified Streptomyces]MYR75200.1 hypothetical protein [Streptomyces sp. SID4925]SBU98168.1 hypothetical protein YUMDRAFT_06079 [Streptomyces sp. OspMP-M45]